MSTIDHLRKIGLSSELHDIQDLQSLPQLEYLIYCSSVKCMRKVSKNSRKGFLVYKSETSPEKIDKCPQCGTIHNLFYDTKLIKYRTDIAPMYENI